MKRIRARFTAGNRRTGEAGRSPGKDLKMNCERCGKDDGNPNLMAELLGDSTENTGLCDACWTAEWYPWRSLPQRELKPVRFDRLSESFQQAMKGVPVEDMGDFLSIQNFPADARKLQYTWPLGCDPVYVLERTVQEGIDGVRFDVWQFMEDFTAMEAAAFLEAQNADR